MKVLLRKGQDMIVSKKVGPIISIFFPSIHHGQSGKHAKMMI